MPTVVSSIVFSLAFSHVILLMALTQQLCHLLSLRFGPAGTTKQQAQFHRRGAEFTEVGVFFIKNSLLRVLSASALKIVLIRPLADPR
jgi:hypothetical protein